MNESPHDDMSIRRRRPAWRGWLILCAIGVAIWQGWCYLPPIARTPFYAAALMFQDAPTALPVPVDGVRSGQLVDTWNAARGNNRRHQGIDIFARRGTPVLSTTEGIVTRIGSSKLGGNVVWLMGPGGQHHYYAHLDSYADIGIGTRVVPGSVLGYVGNTGNARTTPPHLHYGLYTATGAINPYQLLKQTPVASSDSQP